VSLVANSQELATGWELGVPVEDTILRRYVFNSSDRVEHMATATGGTAHRFEHVSTGDMHAPSPFGNQAILLRPLREADADAVVDTVRASFTGPHVLFSAWPTPDLRRHGYALVGHPPFMVRPVGGSAPVRPRELDVIEATDATSMEAYDRVFVEGYPVPELQPYQPGSLFGSRVLGGIARAWVGTVDGRPVAGSMAFTSRGIVGVENVATLRDARGHGYGAALTATAALSRPDLPSALIASDDGRGVYERLGFLPISRFTLWAVQ
jgi:GNAT superfamily N-acetyltransferase